MGDMDPIFELFGDDDAAPAAATKTPVPEPDLSSTYGRYLECGHMNWYSGEVNAAASEAGHCCANGKNKHPISWQHLRGKYVRPLPTNLRRTVDKERSGGFPGYCCDDGGLYIGGVGNDCRHNGTDGRRCAFHRIVPKSKFKDDEVEEAPPAELEPEVVPEPEPQGSVPSPPSMPKATGGSWKQRQLSAKRGRR